MSVLITVSIDGDTDTFRASLAERETDYRMISEQAKAAGALHHRFGAGDGFILIVDEWATQDQFDAFFSDARLHQFIKEVGGDPDTAEVTTTEAITSPDQF